MEAGIARQAAAKAQAEGNAEEAKKQMEECDRLTKGAYAKLHHDMQHFVTEATVEQLEDIKTVSLHVQQRRRKQESMRLKYMEIVFLVPFVQKF